MWPGRSAAHDPCLGRVLYIKRQHFLFPPHGLYSTSLFQSATPPMPARAFSPFMSHCSRAHSPRFWLCGVLQFASTPLFTKFRISAVPVCGIFSGLFLTHFISRS